jgi:hypothetical protein
MEQALREIGAGKKLREAFPFLVAPGDREAKRAEPGRP